MSLGSLVLSLIKEWGYRRDMRKQKQMFSYPAHFEVLYVLMKHVNICMFYFRYFAVCKIVV